MKRTITAEVFAFTSPYNRIDAEDLASGDIASKLVYTPIDMTESGYTLVGRATVTVVLDDQQDVVRRQVANLKQKIENIRADAQAEINGIESQIRNLQSLTFESVKEAA